MKINKLTLLLSVLVTAVLLLTACNSETASVTDKKGKSISVSTPDSDTYIFKLTSDSVSVVSEETSVIEEEESNPTTVSSNSTKETEEASEGPKTGEP